MFSLVSSVLEPVSDLKFGHFQAPRQKCALVACKILLAGKYLVEILELTLSEMAAISPLPFTAGLAFFIVARFSFRLFNHLFAGDFV